MVRRGGIILFLLLAMYAGYSQGKVKPKDTGDYGVTDGDIILEGDERAVIWYNDTDWWSLRADSNMVTDANYVWPWAVGDVNSVLFIRQIEDTNEVYLDWGGFGDANGLLPKKTPWNIMYVGSDRYPLTEDPNYFTYYAPERAFGVGIEYIGEGLYANNYIQVYSLLDFEPNLLNVTIGRGSDDTATGPNNVTIGNSAGAGLGTGTRNTLGGNFAGESLLLRDDNSLYGFEAGKNTGGGALSGSLSSYKFSYASETNAILGIQLRYKSIVTLDADDAVNVGGGIVGINFDNENDAGEMLFVSGDVVEFHGTSNYDSQYTLTAGTTASQLQFTASFSAETFDGTETVIRYIDLTLFPSYSAGLGRMVQDSSGNLYVAHALDAVSGGEVTKITSDGTQSQSFLNWESYPYMGTSPTGWSLKISADDQYLYLLHKEVTVTVSRGWVDKYNLVTGDLEWSTANFQYPGYEIAIDADGNAYVGSSVSNATIQFAADTGIGTNLVGMSRMSNEMIVDNTLGIVIGGGFNSSVGQGNYNMAVRTFDNSAGDQVAVGGEYQDGGVWKTYTLANGCIVSDGAYIYALVELSAGVTRIYKYSWDGSSLTEITNVAGPTYGIGLYIDLWGNLVAINQNAGSPQTDLFWYYDTDLNYVTKLDNLNENLRTWCPAVSGALYQGDVVFYPGLEKTNDEGDNNTAVGSQALRGVDGGAEPNDAAVVGYKAAYPVTTANAPTSLGAYSLGQITSGDENLAIGPYAGWPITTESDYIVFDSRKQATINEMETHSIIVGQTADDPNDQWLSINVGELNLDFGRFDVNDVNVSNDLVVAGTADLNDVDISGTLTAVDVTISGTLDVNDVNATGDVILQAATASRLVATDAGKILESTDLVSWIDGTANQVIVTDDADGTVTLSTPQDIGTDSDVSFGSIELTKGSGFLVLVTGDYLLLTDGTSKMLLSGTTPVEDAVVYVNASNKLGMDPAFLWDSPTQTLSVDGTSKFGDGGTTDYINIDSDGDTRWVGGGGLPFGDMYTNATIAVTISDNNPTEILDATNDGFTAGNLHDITFPTGGDEHYLTVTYAGHYLISYSVTCSQNTPAAAINIEAGIMVGGAAQNPGRSMRTVANSTDIGNMGGTCVLDLAASAQVSLYITNETNTTNIDVEHANLTVVHVGGT